MTFDIIKLNTTVNIHKLKDYYNTVKLEHDDLRWHSGIVDWKDCNFAIGEGYNIKNIYGWQIDTDFDDIKIPNAPYDTTKNRNPYFKETKLNFGYVNLIKNHFYMAEGTALTVMPPRSSLGTHIDYHDFYKIHIPIISDSNFIFTIDEKQKTMDADGSVYILNTKLEHSVINNGETDRAHLILRFPIEMLDAVIAQEGYIDS